jgi:hypothetical protein
LPYWSSGTFRVPGVGKIAVRIDDERVLLDLLACSIIRGIHNRSVGQAWAIFVRTVHDLYPRFIEIMSAILNKLADFANTEHELRDTAQRLLGEVERAQQEVIPDDFQVGASGQTLPTPDDGPEEDPATTLGRGAATSMGGVGARYGLQLVWDRLELFDGYSRRPGPPAIYTLFDHD